MDQFLHQLPSIIAILAVMARFEKVLRDMQDQQGKHSAAYLASIDNIVQKYGSVVRMVTEKPK